jgi:uncharacterized protein YndB with AHSA1/START domain
MTDTVVAKSPALIIERVFDAPRALVWKAWTDPEMAKKWWGPKAFTAPTINIDLKVGGKYLFCMRGPGLDGKVQDFWSTGTYKEIVPIEKLVMTDSFADEKGNVVPSSHYGMPGMPLELEVVVLFEDLGDGKTKMTLEHRGFPEGEHKTMASAGWNESFDKLAKAITN